jgi:hypothetical protein
MRRAHTRADEIGDRLLELVAHAEIEPRGVHEKARGLNDRRLIETELMAQLSALVCRGLNSDHLVYRIADIAEHREGDQPDRDQDADRRQYTAQEESDQSFVTQAKM